MDKAMFSMLKILLAVLGAIALCVIGVYLFTAPAFFERFDLSNDKVGNSINGLTAPIIGLISAFLLYLALIRQTDALALQRQQMETDILLNELQRIERYIDQFYDTRTHTSSGLTERVTTTGIEGMHDFSRFIAKIAPEPNVSLGAFYQSRIIILIIRSIRQLESRLALQRKDNSLNQAISNKIRIIKEIILVDVLQAMIQAVANGKLAEDHVYKEIVDFGSFTDSGAVENYLNSKIDLPDR